MALAWRSKLFLPILIIVLAGLVFYAWLAVYFTLGEDLVVDLSSNQTSFRITNDEFATVQAKIDSRAQLFCDTLCDLELYDADGKLQHQENFTTHSGDHLTREFILRPKERGSGQSVYSLRLMCYNQKSVICPSAGVAQKDTVLLSVNYELPKDVELLKTYLQSTIPRYLETLVSSDENIIGLNFLLTNSSVHAGQTLASIATAQENIFAQRLLLEKIKQEYSKEDYSIAAQSLSNVSEKDVDLLFNQTEELKIEILKLPTIHNALRDRLDIVRTNYINNISEYPFLLSDPYAGVQIQKSIFDLNKTIDLYNSNSYSSYSSLDAQISNLENMSLLYSTLHSRADTVMLIGNSLIQSELDLECAINITVSCRNVSFTNIVDVCSELVSYNTTAILQFNNAYCDENIFYSPNLASDLGIDNSTLELVPVFVWPNIASTIDSSLPNNYPKCCVFGQCKTCCNDDVCANDPQTYPVIFVHGHSFNGVNTPDYSLGGYFANIQQALEHDGYIDAGIVTPSSGLDSSIYGEWGLSGRPVTARVTYYYDFYRSGDSYVLVPQKSESIETYALRLNDMINIIKHNTRKKKVNIVAHSMGGLVTRRYIQLFGEDSVESVVLVATPNNGTQGRTQTICPFFGESKECTDMSKGSVFMQKVNDPYLQPKNIKFTTIAGTGCTMNGDNGDVQGDGVVITTSVALPFAKNFIVNGTCTDFLGSDFHSEILNINIHPEVYKIIKDALVAK